MSPFRNILQVLAQPPGSLAYHIIVLFALEAMVGIAWEEWRRMRRQEYQTMSTGFTMAIALQALWLILEVFRWRGLLDAQVLLWLWPPLRDLVWTVVAALLLLSFVPVLLSMLPSKQQLWMIGVTGLALVAFAVVSMVVWRSYIFVDPRILYGRYWISWAWGILRLLLFGLGSYLAFFRAEEQRWALGTGFILLLLGQIAYLGKGLETDASIAASWLRIAQLTAFPLFAFSVYRGIVSDLYSYGMEFKTVSEESLRQTRELLFLLETSKATSSTLDLEEILDGLVENVVLALNADQCAIATYAPEEANVLIGQAVYDPLHGDQFSRFGGKKTEPRIEAEAYPIVQHAIERRQQVISNQVESNGATREIFELMGSKDAGPLIVQPLVSNDNVLGLLFIGNSRSKRPFFQSDGNLCQAIAGQVATAMENAHLYESLESRAENLRQKLDSQQKEGSQGQEILSQAAIGILGVDADKRVAFANATAGDILDQSPEELEGKRLGEILPPLSTKVKGPARGQIVSYNGKRLQIDLVPQKQGDRALALLRDVTNDLQGEQATREFVRVTARELRLPLTAIQGYADLLLEGNVGEVNEAQRKFLEKTHYNTLRMGEMVDDLVDIAEIGLTGISLDLQPTNIAEVLATSTVAVQDLIEEKKLTIDFDLEEDLPTMLADEERLQQALANLVENACKYTPENSRIRVQARRCKSVEAIEAEECLAISITDSGVGISDEEQDEIFQPFYRADNPLSIEAGGAGLGLPVAKAITEAHGGHIQVESALDEGSTFRMVLPIRQERQASDTA
jgi:signal transduction histidine kinase